MPSTLREVALAAGVSYQTVSRVINEHSAVAARTRERVLRAIELLQYEPNEAARQLRRTRDRQQPDGPAHPR